MAIFSKLYLPVGFWLICLVKKKLVSASLQFSYFAAKEAEQKPHYDLRPRTPQKYREEQSSGKPLDEESAEPKGKSTEETEIANQSEDSDEVQLRV